MRQARPHTVRQSWSMEVATALRRMRLHLVALFWLQATLRTRTMILHSNG